MQYKTLKDIIRMQKIFLTIIALVASGLVAPLNSVVAQDAPSCGSGTYVISAYYSPVPGQGRYATGSYEGDIRLNGGGVTTASGAKVAEAASPFVAAPPCMPFGTELNIEGLGAHTVLDRGGAIKGNRLDIWMGYGDVGLKNALTWGKRSVYVSVDGAIGNSNSFNFDIGKNSLKSYQVVQVQDPFNFMRDLAFGDTGEDVARLQQILKDLGYYKLPVSGTYDAGTKTALESFNKANGVIENSNLAENGRFGSTAVARLRNAVVSNREKYLNLPSRNLGRGSTGEDVKKLQQFLYSLGLLDSVTGVYDSKTVDAVLAFQLSEKVITSNTEQGAGYFGPATQLAFDKVVLSLENSIAVKSVADVVPSSDDVTLASLSADEMLTDALQEGASGDQVRILQQILKDLGYLNIEVSGYFGPITTNAVFKFQQKMQLVSGANDKSAGFVGPETRASLNKYLNSKAYLAKNLKQKATENLVELASQPSEPKFVADLAFGVSHPEVKELQQFLRNRGYFAGQLLTEYFGPATKSALIKFKEDNKLGSSELFDKATKDLLNSLI